MFGENYFAMRERFAALMRGIDGIARETATDLADLLPLHELADGPGPPVFMVVCGEVNAGKSSFINSLFGHDLCRVNVLPETRSILWYRHGNPARGAEIAPLVEERRLPLEFLKDFNPVDTPGTNSANPALQEIASRFLPAADLIFFVFPVTNPWGAATWNFISGLSSEMLDRAVFVIQQADQREADLPVIRGHMADLAMKRLGRVPPIFAVSAKLAQQAGSAAPAAQDLLRASGYPAVGDFISRHIDESPSRRSMIRDWHGQASAALRCVEERIEEQTRAIESHNRFMDGIEREIDRIREQFVTRLPQHLAEVAGVFETEADWTAKRLRGRLRALPSLLRLFIGDRTGREIEAAFTQRLQAAVETVAEKDGDEVVDACEEHWEKLGERVKSTMGVDLTTASPVAETLATAKARFVAGLGSAAGLGIGNLKVRNHLDKELRRRNLALRSFMLMAMVLVTAGAICGALGVPWAPAILCGLGAAFFSGAVLTAWKTGNAITHDFQIRLLDTCGAFASTLRADYEDALRLVFRDYATCLSDVRTHIARQKLSMEPRLQRWQDLFLTLKAIEQDLP